MNTVRTVVSRPVRGTVTIVACVNPGAMRARIPALNPADGLNINRMFPGDAGGSASQRTAAWLMELQSESDFYIDMHGGDVHEKLSPYVYIPGACEERVTAAARRAAAGRWARCAQAVPPESRQIGRPRPVE